MNGTLGKLFVACCFVSFLTLGEPSTVIPTTGGATVTIPDDPIPMVALTFDDGPKRETTERLLDGLALREVPATFFLIGAQLAGNEDLVLRMGQEGHQIGLHSYNHLYLQSLSRTDFDFQVTQQRELLTELLPNNEFWLRPPYGIFDKPTQLWADSPIILWSLDTKDWENHDANYIAELVTMHAKNGDIILLHDIYDSSVDGALAIVDALTDRGFTFGTVEQVLRHQGIEPQNGVIYPQVPWLD